MSVRSWHGYILTAPDQTLLTAEGDSLRTFLSSPGSFEFLVQAPLRKRSLYPPLLCRMPTREWRRGGQRQMSMTEFGFLLSELMERRGVDVGALATAFAERGYEQANEYLLVAYMQGELEVDPRLPSFLAGALTL